MNKGIVITLGVVGVMIVSAIMAISYIVGVLNQEMAIRTTIEAKMRDNTSQYDNLWKKISQTAQVTDAQKEAIKEIVVGYANARSQGRDGAGSFVNALHEAIPNVDVSTFKNLQNIITGSRDSFTMRQTELLDLNREHEKLIRTIPSSIICSMFNRGPINVTIVTSSKTEHSFATGKDDDINVFQK